MAAAPLAAPPRRHPKPEHVGRAAALILSAARDPALDLREQPRVERATPRGLDALLPLRSPRAAPQSQGAVELDQVGRIFHAAFYSKPRANRSGAHLPGCAAKVLPPIEKELVPDAGARWIS